MAKCSLCGKEIEDVALIELTPSIVIQNPDLKEPIVYNSPQQRSYYATKIILHDRCFIVLCGTRTALKLEGGLGLIPVSQ